MKRKKFRGIFQLCFALMTVLEAKVPVQQLVSDQPMIGNWHLLLTAWISAFRTRNYSELATTKSTSNLDPLDKLLEITLNLWGKVFEAGRKLNLCIKESQTLEGVGDWVGDDWGEGASIWFSTWIGSCWLGNKLIPSWTGQSSHRQEPATTLASSGLFHLIFWGPRGEEKFF